MPPSAISRVSVTSPIVMPRSGSGSDSAAPCSTSFQRASRPKLSSAANDGASSPVASGPDGGVGSVVIGAGSLGKSAGEGVGEAALRLLPAAADGAGRAVESRGDFVLRETEVPDHLEELPLVVGQRLDELVEPRPLGELLASRALVGGNLHVLPGGGVACGVRVVVGGHRSGMAVAPGEIDQLAADLQGGETEEVLGVVRGDGAEGPMEAEEGALHDVVGLFPAADAGGAGEHPMGERPHAIGGEGDELLASLRGRGGVGRGDGGEQRPKRVAAGRAAGVVVDLVPGVHLLRSMGGGLTRTRRASGSSARGGYPVLVCRSKRGWESTERVLAADRAVVR